MHSIKRYNFVKAAIIVSFLLLVFSLTSPLPVDAQEGDYGVALTHEDGLDQSALEIIQLDDAGVMSKTIFLRDLFFSFLATMTGLSSLFWIIVSGGLKL